MRNAFGDLLADPGHLSRSDRIDLLRRQAGRLLADTSRESRWLGERLSAWLRDGGELDAVLGVRAPRGSRETPQARVRQDEIDSLLLRLSVQAGGDRQAIEILRGQCACPGLLCEIVGRLKALRAPTSQDAMTRARRRAAAHSR
jgi:hypothetical protein